MKAPAVLFSSRDGKGKINFCSRPTWQYKLVWLSECVMFICWSYQWPAWTDLFIITYLVHTRLHPDSSFGLVLSLFLNGFLWLVFLMARTDTLKTCSVFAGLSQTCSTVYQKWLELQF